MTKDQWIELLKEIGIDEDGMQRWHRCFETRYPDGHQSFLEWLNVPPDEIRRIRAS